MFTTNRIDIKGVVFDFDNTLVDTKTTIYEGYKLVFSEIAKKFNIDKERKHYKNKKLLTEPGIDCWNADIILLYNDNGKNGRCSD